MNQINYLYFHNTRYSLTKSDTLYKRKQYLKRLHFFFLWDILAGGISLHIDDLHKRERRKKKGSKGENG